MKAMKLLLGLVLALGFVSLVGCKKSGGDQSGGAVAPTEIQGVKVDIGKLNQAMETATPEQQATARNIQMAFRYGQYEKALMEADKLANDATLNEQQKKVATDVLEQVKQVVAKAPPAPAAQ